MIGGALLLLAGVAFCGVGAVYAIAAAINRVADAIEKESE